MKLVRLLAKHRMLGRREARQHIVLGRAAVNGQTVTRLDTEVDRFSKVELSKDVVQKAKHRLHLMLNKPTGFVSATEDKDLPTVIDLIKHPEKGELHLVGRLDRSTSGLILLTNDGRWSKRMMNPESKVPKVYLVETERAIPFEAVSAFKQGFHFQPENLVTLPAELELLEPRRARLTLHEGRYHQVKRMFHRIGNRVVALHRIQIGDIMLPSTLSPGEWRALSLPEIGETAS